jgi:hypothetical protein
MPDITQQSLLRRLLMYVHANPDASDSTLGIARWWLDPNEGVDVDALTQVLELLVADGVFAERVGADGRRSFRRICSDDRLRQLLGEP